MKKNTLKPLALCVTSSFILACGSSSSTKEDLSTAAPLPEEISNTNSEDFTLSSQNYVEIASQFYHSTINGIASPLAEQEEVLTLPVIQYGNESSVTHDCSVSGEFTRVLLKYPLSENTIHTDDSIETDYNNCRNYLGIQDGTRSMEVKLMEGIYGRNDYAVHTKVSRDITSDEGMYSNRLPIIFAQSQINDGDVNYIGINVGILDANVTPYTYISSVIDTELELVESDELIANPVYYESPDKLINTFAFEQIIDDSLYIPQTIYRWWFQVSNKTNASASYSIKTTEALVLEEREFIDEDGYEETNTVAIAGSFNVTMETGEKILIQVLSDDNDNPENVIVSFDDYGDGALDDRVIMHWNEFESAMFGYMRFTPYPI